METYQQHIEKRLIKRNMRKYAYVECGDWADTKEGLLPLEFYQDGEFVYIENEKQIYEVASRLVLSFVSAH